MNQDAWIKVAQALTMMLTAFGIEMTDIDTTTIVTGAFGLLSVLSAIKAWMSKKGGGLVQPTRLEQATLKSIAEDIKNKQVERKIMIREYNAKVKEGKA